jgi:hypothetical protein
VGDTVSDLRQNGVAGPASVYTNSAKASAADRLIFDSGNEQAIPAFAEALGKLIATNTSS